MFINFYALNQITAIDAGEPNSDFTFLVYGDLLLVDAEISDDLAELHVAIDAGFVEMENIRVGNMLDFA